jgi:hypothetical protein
MAVEATWRVATNIVNNLLQRGDMGEYQTSKTVTGHGRTAGKVCGFIRLQ